MSFASVCRLRSISLTGGCLLSLAACGKGDAAKDADAPPADEARVQAVVSATVVPVETTRFDETIEAVGAVAGHPGRVAQLAAPAPTRVARVNAAVGQFVAAGAVLVEFEVAPFEAAKVGAERALEVAEKAAARASRLADAGVSPRKEAELAQAELAVAQSNAITARRTRELAVLRAPFAGVITKQVALLGASVDATQPLIEVADPSQQDVLLTLAPADAARVHVGNGVVLSAGTTAGMTTGAVAAHGRVADIAAAVDSASGGVAVRVAVTSRERTVRFGESLVGRIAVASHANALVVPVASLVPNGEGYRVFVVDSAGVAHATDVQVGGRSADGVWIREGLEAGQRVVSGGAFGMDDGAKVAPASAAGTAAATAKGAVKP